MASQKRRKWFRKKPTLRTARIVYLLAKGKKLTTAQIADLTGLSHQGAWAMMDVIASSHDVPVTCVDGYWQIMEIEVTLRGAE